jgi:hypothetical protein
MRTRHLHFSCLVASLLLLLPTAASAQGTTSNVDIGMLSDTPVLLGGIDYLPTQIFGVVPGGYALAYDAIASDGFPPEARFDALTVVEGISGNPLMGGIFAFSVDTPVTVGVKTIRPSDIVLKRGIVGSDFDIVLSGASLGLAESENIDALARAGSGQWIISFDTPVEVGPWTIQPADLVLASPAGLSPYLTGMLLGLGPGINVTGFEQNPGPPNAGLFFTFDTPVGVGMNVILPGQIAKYADGIFSPVFSDPLFPRESALTDFALPPSPGEVPDGSSVPGVPLTVQTAPGGDIQLSWGAACIPSGTDYAVYEGTIGSWYDHASRLCTTGGATNAVLAPGRLEG